MADGVVESKLSVLMRRVDRGHGIVRVIVMVVMTMTVMHHRGHRIDHCYTNADERQSIMTDGSLRGIRYYPNAFTFLAMQQLGRRTNVTFDFLGASDYVSGSFFVGGGSRPYLFPGPRRANVAASYTLPLNDRSSVMFFTRVENAFNQLYFEDGFQTPKAWAVGGIKWLF